MLVGAFALTIAAVLVSQSRQVVHARDSWGTSVEVWVAAADTSPGSVIVVERRAVPLAMVPDDAVEGAWPAGVLARQALTAGEIVVAHDVGAGRLSLLPDGWRAVAVLADEGTIPVAVGDHVDVVAAGVVIASAGVVVQAVAGVVVVGVSATDAPAVATAALDRTAVVVVRPD